MGQLNLQWCSSSIEEQVGQIRQASTDALPRRLSSEAFCLLTGTSVATLRGFGNIIGDDGNLVRDVDWLFAHRDR